MKIFLFLVLTAFQALGGQLYIENRCPHTAYAAIAEPRQKAPPSGPTMGFLTEYQFNWGWVKILPFERSGAFIQPKSDHVFVRIHFKGKIDTPYTSHDLTECVSSDAFKFNSDLRNSDGTLRCPEGARAETGFQRARLSSTQQGTYIIDQCDGETSKPSDPDRMPWCAVAASDRYEIWVQHHQQGDVDEVCRGVSDYFREQTGGLADHRSKGYFNPNKQNTVKVDCSNYFGRVSGFGHDVWPSAIRLAQANRGLACHFWVD